jgi:hypothetical protein
VWHVVDVSGGPLEDLPSSVELTTNVMHRLAGAGYGASHGLAFSRRGPVAGGLATGVGASGDQGSTNAFRPIACPSARIVSTSLSKRWRTCETSAGAPTVATASMPGGQVRSAEPRRDTNR